MNDREGTVLRLVVVAWVLLGASIATWPGAGIGRLTTVFAFAPALALAITEILVNPPARLVAGATLALAFLAFAAIVAALRSRPST